MRKFPAGSSGKLSGCGREGGKGRRTKIENFFSHTHPQEEKGEKEVNFKTGTREKNVGESGKTKKNFV